MHDDKSLDLLTYTFLNNENNVGLMAFSTNEHNVVCPIIKEGEYKVLVNTYNLIKTDCVRVGDVDITSEFIKDSMESTLRLGGLKYFSTFDIFTTKDEIAVFVRFRKDPLLVYPELDVSGHWVYIKMGNLINNQFITTK